MAKVRVTQVISKNSATERQQANLLSLGIHRINQTVEVELTPVTKGMIEKVRHLVKIEEVAE
jgi:large subunit ribosomal protein L30